MWPMGGVEISGRTRRFLQPLKTTDGRSLLRIPRFWVVATMCKSARFNYRPAGLWAWQNRGTRYLVRKENRRSSEFFFSLLRPSCSSSAGDSSRAPRMSGLRRALLGSDGAGSSSWYLGCRLLANEPWAPRDPGDLIRFRQDDNVKPSTKESISRALTGCHSGTSLTSAGQS